MSEQTVLKTVPATLWRMTWRLVGEQQAHEDYYETLEDAMAAVRERAIADYGVLTLAPVAAEMRWLTAAGAE